MAATEISVGVESSAGTRKRRSVVTLTRDDDGTMRMRCSCRAAVHFGELCHHRLQIAAGDIAFAANQPDVDLVQLRLLVRDAPWYGDAHRLFGMVERHEGQKSLAARALRVAIATQMNGFPPKARDRRQAATRPARQRPAAPSAPAPAVAPPPAPAAPPPVGSGTPTRLEDILSFTVRTPEEAGATHSLTLRSDGTPAGLRLHCSCAIASAAGQLCTHRLQIASGDFSLLADPNAANRSRLTRALLAAPWWDDLIELDWLTSARLAPHRPGRVADLRRAIAAAMTGPAPAVHPGALLTGEFLPSHGLTPDSLADALPLPRIRIDPVLAGTAPVTADLALHLARVLGTSAEFWMTLQASHDLARARAKLSKASVSDDTRPAEAEPALS